MRGSQALHGLLASLLLATAIHAPLDHVHPGETAHDHDHDQRFAQHHRSTTPAWESRDHDDDAQWRDWLSDETGSRQLAPVILSLAAYSAALPLRSLATPVVRPRSHDPPVRGLLPARSPPFSL
jgi:hypothetical protein